MKHTSTPAEPAPSGSAAFRPDVEGLRAFAVLSVLVYHAGLVWLPGGFAGVDVFFVISGFLITSLMAREVTRTGGLRLGAFWARRARRLLPAATLTLVFSAIITIWLLPVTSRKPFGGDIIAAAAYVVNWRLGMREVDYLAGDVTASPVQHFWSLAVEEQFYLIWPLLFVGVLWLFRRWWRRALVVTITLITAGSFLFALHYSVAQPGLSFFVSTTRAWELGVGALLALSYAKLARLPGVLLALIGWAGLAAMVAGVLTIESDDVWPGMITLLPVLGTAAVILAGASNVGWGPKVLLGMRPAVWIGGLSYSLYLWHWPVLIAAEGHWGHLRVRYAMLVILVSVIPAWLSYKFVEDPVRRGQMFAGVRRGLSLGAAGMTTAIAAGVAVILSFGLVTSVEVASAKEAPGAAVLRGPTASSTDWSEVDSVDKMRPDPLKLKTALADLYDTDCIVPRDFEGFKACEFADKDSDKTVVLVGDSKAMQWFTPVRDIAEAEGWRLVVIGKNGCQFADVSRRFSGHRNPSCEEWTTDAMEEVAEQSPDVVITVTHVSEASPLDDPDAPATTDAMVDGLASRWKDVLGTGSKLVAVLDNPGPGRNMPECVQANLDHLTNCVFAPKRMGGAKAQRLALEQVPEAGSVDMLDVLCPDDRCPPVIGNVMIYRTGTHITDQYAASATPQFAHRLAQATDGELGKAWTKAAAKTAG